MAVGYVCSCDPSIYSIVNAPISKWVIANDSIQIVRVCHALHARKVEPGHTNMRSASGHWRRDTLSVPGVLVSSRNPLRHQGDGDIELLPGGNNGSRKSYRNSDCL